MTRLRYNGLKATLGASLTNSATAVTFSAALTHSNGTAVPTITGSDYIPLSILDSAGALSEIVYLTAYTTAGTTGTITRGQEGTAGVSHSSGDKVVNSGTVADFTVGVSSGVRVSKSADQSLSASTFTAVTWDVEDYDDAAYHDVSTNTTRLTAAVAGTYVITATVFFSWVSGSTSSVERIVQLRKNGVAGNAGIVGRSEATSTVSGGSDAVNCATVVRLNAGDYVEVLAYYDSGGVWKIDTAVTHATMTLAVGGGVGGSMTAPIVRGSNAATANASSVVVAIPSATVAGDLLLAFCSSGYQPVADPPAGWQLLDQSVTVQPTGVFENSATYTRVAQVGDAGTNVTFSFTGSYACGGSIVAVAGASAIQESSIRGIGNATATTLQLASTGGGDGFLTVVFSGARVTSGTTTSSFGTSIATSTNASSDGCVVTALAGSGASVARLLLTHSTTAVAISGAAIKIRGAGGSGGGSGGSGGSTLLGLASYNPGSLATTTTTSTTPVDIDATNLAVTFTAPASGSVLVDFSGYTSNLTPDKAVLWHVLDGSTTKASRYVHNPATYGSAGVTANFRITGLTSGTSYTYKWAHSTESGGTARLLYGGVVGEAVITVRDAAVGGGSGSSAARSCRVYNSAAQSIPNGTPTVVTWDSEDYDTANLHSTSTNTSRITLDTPGVWLVTGQISYAAGSGGERDAQIRLNGSTVLSTGYIPPNSTYYGTAATSTLVQTTLATDYVELLAYHDAGSSLNTRAGAGISWFSAIYLGGLAGNPPSRDRRWSVGSGETSIDEFNDNALDVAWVRMDGTGVASGNQTWTEGADSLAGKNNGSDTSGKYHALVRPIGTSMVVGDAFITAMNVLGFFNATTYSLIGGLFLTTSATFGSGEQVAGISYFDQNADRWIAETTTITGNSGVADSGLVLLGMANPGLHYIRLVYIATNTWRTDLSPDGVSWILGSNISKTMTPTHVGFCASSNNANQAVASFEFLRRVSGVT